MVLIKGLKFVYATRIRVNDTLKDFSLLKQWDLD